jgi:hypothetical protein
MLTAKLYQPNEVDLNVELPETWDELQKPELVVIGAGYFGREASMVSVMMAILENRIDKENHHIIPLISVEDLATEYSALTGFISERIDRTQNIEIPFLIAPLADFEDITVGEFEESDIALSLYINEGNPEHLVDFFKAYYRMDKSLQDHLPDVGTMRAAALCFIGCKTNLHRTFPLVFGSGEASSTNSPDYMALTKLIHHGAGPKNGTREDIRRMPLKEFLYDCQLEAEKAPDVF